MLYLKSWIPCFLLIIGTVKFAVLIKIRLTMKNKKKSLNHDLYPSIIRDLLIAMGLCVLGLVFIYFGFRVANPWNIVLNVFAGLTVLIALAVGAYIMTRMSIVYTVEVFKEESNRINAETNRNNTDLS